MKSVNLKLPWNNPYLPGAAGALWVLLVGLFLLHFNSLRLAKVLQHSSYDWAFDLSFFPRTAPEAPELILIYLDESSHRSLGQPLNRPWDRALHARLLDRLTADGAKAVIFDIVFSDPSTNNPAADPALAQAIKSNGKVILAADLVKVINTSTGLAKTEETTLTLPFDLFKDAAAGWGIAQLQPDEDFVIREHFHGSREPETSSLSWAAAHLLGLKITADPNQRFKERWVNYYAGAGFLHHVSYELALGMTNGFFRNKIVFIGARPITGFFRERKDEFRSPYSSWYEVPQFMPAVEIHATIFLNLMRGDWLTRLPPAAEWALFLLVALAFGLGLPLFRPLPATALALVGGLTFTLLVLLLFGLGGFWFPWLIAVAAQIPLALLWAVLVKSFEWYVHRRRFESRIRQQAALLDKAQDAILVHDLEWKITFWNKSAERLYGWTADEVLTHNLLKKCFPTIGQKLAEARQCALEKGEWNGELRPSTKTGQELIVESRWTLVRDPDQTPQSILVINTDVTEKKKLETQFLRTQRMESIGTLAGGIAHDLNNVLTPILMAVQLLQIRCQEEEIRRVLTTLESNVKRGADMVKQVLTFARGHEGERTVLQLSHLIREMDKFIRETFPKSIQVRLHLGENPWTVLGDATQLHQVLLNLCVNARDAMPNGGQILIETQNHRLQPAEAQRFPQAKSGHYLLLSVSDTGTGIAPDIAEHIFEPFFTTKLPGKGTGLGLSTVNIIVKAHGGFLNVKSQVGKGSTFFVYLPASDMAPPPPRLRVNHELLVGHGELVLVVDDEQAIREITKSTLLNYGYQVLTAADGDSALSAFQLYHQQIALVVMDLMMPAMDGAAAVQSLKRLKPALPIIVVSGWPQTHPVKDLLSMPGVIYLPKPFTGELLLETVAKSLRPQPDPPFRPSSAPAADHK